MSASRANEPVGPTAGGQILLASFFSSSCLAIPVEAGEIPAERKFDVVHREVVEIGVVGNDGKDNADSILVFRGA